jgi:hypothetical protein
MRRRAFIGGLHKGLQTLAVGVFIDRISAKTCMGMALDKVKKDLSFSFEVYDELTIREKPTTQVAVHIDQWPGQVPLLWLPESVADSVSDLWDQWDPVVVPHQDFTSSAGGGLYWKFAKNPKATIISSLVPRRNSLLLEVRVKNTSRCDLREVSAQNCIILSRAPDFACDDFSRLYIRTNGEWRSLKALGVTDDLPMFYRPSFLESGRTDAWHGHFAGHNQKARADQALMMCTSKQGDRTIGTASDHYQCVFHNHGIKYLLCIHSQQAPIPILRPGEEVSFRQVIYFVEGGIQECVLQFQEDVKSGFLKP